MKKSLITGVLFLTFYHSTAQVEMFDPVLFPGNDVFDLTISPDGNEIFFVRSFGGRDTLHLYHSVKTGNEWQPPKPAPFGDINLKQIDPAFSPDGKTLLFNSLTSAESSFDIFIVAKNINGWGVPVRLSDFINTGQSDFFATMSRKRNIYFTRRASTNDIYVSYFENNGYRKAVPLDSTINTSGNESNPYISPDEDYLIYFADYKGGFGDTDLYISFRKNKRWSIPMNLGSVINTDISEFCPGMDFKNKRFLFARTKVIDGRRIENIYMYPLKKLKLKKLKRTAKWKI